MIVKDESAVIRRCLDSAKPLIDYWIIVDTGSTDGTQKIIRDCMKGVPGELHEQPWVNFEVNRNQALALCKGKGDYVLLIDADEEFSWVAGFSLPKLDKDAYQFKVHEEKENSIDFIRWLLINNYLSWKWTGVIHETIECPERHTLAFLDGIYVISRSTEGHRAKNPNKFLDDAAILEEALKKDPSNKRYTFYLAQSYLNAEEFNKSLHYYQKRAAMEGDPGEIFIS
jgi:glycosyltransferase involved in cell wall biosynthesis